MNGYTSHGHAIVGLEQTGEPPAAVARCGGPAICSVCARDAAAQIAAAPSMTGVMIPPSTRPVVW